MDPRKKAAEIENIDKAAITLLDKLADFRTGDVQSASGKNVNTSKSDAIGTFYIWERTIWAKLNVDERIRVKEMRQDVENRDYHTLYEKGCNRSVGYKKVPNSA